MVQNYKKNLTYASKSKEKFTFFSLYKQISISKIFRCFFLVPHLHYLSLSSLSGTTLFCDCSNCTFLRFFSEHGPVMVLF